MAGFGSRRLSLEELIIKLHEVEGVKFGDFKLKSGISSPVYFDLRVIISYPDLMIEVSEFLWDAAEKSGSKTQSVCGVPYTALPLATIMSAKHKTPMLIRRKEAKDYGTKKLIEGAFKAGDTCLIVEDIVTSGTSVWETVEALSGVGIKVTDAVVLLDREQGGAERLKAKGVNLHSVCTLSKALEVLQGAGKLSTDMVQKVQDFIAANKFSANDNGVPKLSAGDGQTPTKKAKKELSFGERAQLCSNAVSRRLFEVMEAKQSNLVLSADLTQTLQLLQLVDKTGPHICAVKTHVDIIEDFTSDFGARLAELAEKHNFLIFEDRKFADIGHTVSLQYEGGLYKISDWADIVNAHTVPGSGVVQGLKQVGQPKGGACLLIAEMSSAGNLATPDYAKATVKMAEEHKDFVIGFICQSKLASDPAFLHMTPGVQLQEGKDSLGQQYLTPNEVIAKRHSDIIIVGRGITKAEDPVAVAKKYQEAGYSAYLSRLSQ
ncbi:uridine 5'-monophosphate synthase-like [Littorina saxatilis]|uniref:Uridine 5'-monophosphate synthase n=1 Tax=Littorina saxatilis TaxID=31220 RepID=A0AAN9B4L9_9CAEN